jgi:outer membrane protein assembly complex protein YaeT
MVRFSTIRRRLLLGGGFVVLLSGLSLVVIHTGPVRRFALEELQARLRNRMGLVVEARDLDYNLLTGRVELKDFALHAEESSGLPAPVKAKRVVAVIPVWRLLNGSFESARVQVDGMSVYWLETTAGRNNWPAIKLPGGGGGRLRIPEIFVTGGSVVVQDDPSGLRAQLPVQRLSLVWDPTQSAYVVHCDASGGSLGWKGSQFPIDVAAKSRLANGAFLIDSLRLHSRSSDAEVSKATIDPSGRIDATGQLSLALSELSPALGLPSRTRGRLLLRLSATGPALAPRVNADLTGSDVNIGGIPIGNPKAELLLDADARELQVRRLTAGLLSGVLSAHGRLAFAGRRSSNLAATLSGVDLHRAAGILGYPDAPPVRGSIEIKATAQSLDWRHGGLTGTAQFEPLEVAFKAATSGDLLETSFESRLGNSTQAHGGITFRTSSGSLTGTLKGGTDHLAQFAGGLENLLHREPGSLTGAGVDGSAEWSANLGGSVHRPEASVTLHADDVSAGRVTGATLDFAAGYADSRIGIDRARVDWAGQRIEVNGEVGGFSGGAPLKLDGTVEGNSLAEVFESLGVPQPVDGALSGRVHVAGTLSEPFASTALRTSGLTAWGQSFSGSTLEAQWQQHQIRVTRFTAAQKNGGDIEARGRIDVSNNEFEIDAVGKSLQLSQLRLAEDLPLSGTFQVTAHGKGSLNDPCFDAEVSGVNVKAGSAGLGEVRGDLHAASQRASAHLALPESHITASSNVAMDGKWPFDLAVDAKRTRIETAMPVSFDGTVRASGTLREPQIEKASAAVQALQVTASGEEIVNDGPMELSYEDGRLRVKQFALKSGSSKLRLEGDLPLQDGGPAGALSLQGTLNLATLPNLVPVPKDLQFGGTVDLDASVRGSAEEWQPSGSVTLRGGHFFSSTVPIPVEDIAGKILFEPEMLRVDQLTGKAASGTLEASATVPYAVFSESLGLSGASVGRPAHLSARLGGMQFAGDRSSLNLDAAIEAEAPAFSLSALRATAELRNVDLKGKQNELHQDSPIRFSLNQSVVRMENLNLRAGNSSLTGSGSLDLTGSFPVRLQLAGATDLAVLAALIPSTDAAGALNMDLNVAGTLRDPQTKGFIELDSASLTLEKVPIQARNTHLRAELDKDRITLRQFTGNLNGGTFEGGGDFRIGREGIHDANLFLKGKDAFADYPATVKTTSSLDVRLVSRRDRLVLEGRIEIQEGFHESTLDLFSSSGGPKDSTKDISRTSSSPVVLDLQIVTKRPVEMDNNLGRLSAMANLHLSGPISDPQLTGNVELEPEGRIYFGDHTYYIERGNVRFLEGHQITPDFNIHAYTRAGDYTVYLGLTGKLGEIATSFTSDPPLSRDDVIAVLLTGKTMADNPGMDLRALEASSLATGALNASLSSRLHRTTGVSRVSIQPSAVAAESNPGTRVTITQDFTRDLRLMYSMNLQDSNDQIWVGEYDLSRRFTTRAVKQSDNTYRGEFRHDVRFGSSNEPSTIAQAAARRITRVTLNDAGPFSSEQLAKVFKSKAGQVYRPIKVRKNAESLSSFLAKRGYLESRVRLDRDDDGQGIAITVRIELGPVVDFAFEGVNLPKKRKSQVRELWHAGISDQQRPRTVQNALIDYFASEGYLQADVDCSISGEKDRKLVSVDMKPGLQYHGVKLVIEGADASRVGEVRALLEEPAVKRTLYRDPAPMIESLTGYYRQRGYLAAKVSVPAKELDAAGRTGRIVIPIEEGPVFHTTGLQFSGNHALSAADLQSGLPLQEGAVFEPSRVAPSLAELKTKYGRIGYRDPVIDYTIERDDSRATVEVSFAIVENQPTSIGSISIEGNHHTTAEFARRQLRVEEGQVANTDLIRQSVRNLSQTGAYATADIYLEPPVEAGASDKPVRVSDAVVSITEPKPFRLLYGGLYDSGGGPGFIADFQVRNSLGSGRVLGLRTRADPETEEVRLYMTQPTWNSRHISTTFGIYYTRETEVYQTTPTEKLGASIQQDVQLPSKFLLSYGYRYERQRGFVPDPAAPDIPQTVVAVAPFLISFSRDERDSFLDATRGWFVSNGFEIAPHFLGSDYPYMRYYGQYFKYFPLTRPRPVPFGEKPTRSRLVFATGSRVGLQKGFNSVGAVLTDRFYAGGGTTVRGFGQDELGPKLANGKPAGGNAVLVLNEELRYPMFWVFDAVNFIDVGNVFPRVSDFKFSELRAAWGFGLRIRNPFVVLRFDYGVKFDRRPGEKIGAFFFSIGQAF